MPLTADSSFRPARFRGNGHLQTIWPVLFRRARLITNYRERLELADGDFLDLDWARNPQNDKLVILTHGLESQSRDSSLQAMAAPFFEHGWDVLAWNMRGCSGEANRLLRFYHSGATEDLAAVIKHAAPNYQKTGLVGFSLGGNVVLKYLGEQTDAMISAAVTFSVPCDLTSSVERLDGPANRLYTHRFIGSLRQKIFEKKRRFPDLLNVETLSQMRTFYEFDSAYTAPLHGFSSAEDYWQKSSSRHYLQKISIPTLLVNAANDPFLAPPCFPTEIAYRSEHFHLEIPNSGGHCGFVGSAQWQQRRALEFLEAFIR